MLAEIFENQWWFHSLRKGVWIELPLISEANTVSVNFSMQNLRETEREATLSEKAFKLPFIFEANISKFIDAKNTSNFT